MQNITCCLQTATSQQGRGVEKTEKGKVPRPHHSSDRSMDRVQGLGQTLFAILTTEPHLSQRFDSTPALLKHQTWACHLNSKELLKSVFHVTLQLQFQEPAYFYRIDKPTSNFSTAPCTEGEILFFGWRRACGLAGLHNFQAAAEAPSYAEQLSNCAALFCSWVKFSASSPPPRRRAGGRLLRPAPQAVLPNSATLRGIPRMICRV